MDHLNLNGLRGAQQSTMSTPLGDSEVNREKKVHINIVPATESNRHNTGGDMLMYMPDGNIAGPEVYRTVWMCRPDTGNLPFNTWK